MKRVIAKTATASSSSAIEEVLRRAVLFRAWPQRCIEMLAEHSRIQRHQDKAEVPEPRGRPGDVLVIASGCLEVGLTTAAGKRFLLGLVGPGECCELVRLLDNAPKRLEYSAHGVTEVVHVPCSALRTVLDGEPLLWRDVALLAMRRLATVARVAREQAVNSQSQRVASLLVDIVRLQGVREQEGMLLNLSQDELGSLLGLTRQSVNKELRLLEHAGILSTRRNGITISDMPALLAVAGADGP